jgi:hypothetical protein
VVFRILKMQAAPHPLGETREIVLKKLPSYTPVRIALQIATAERERGHANDDRTQRRVVPIIEKEAAARRRSIV